MNIDVMTRKQAQAYIKQEVAKQLINFYRDLDKVRRELNLVKEELVCVQQEKGIQKIKVGRVLRNWIPKEQKEIKKLLK